MSKKPFMAELQREVERIMNGEHDDQVGGPSWEKTL